MTPFALLLVSPAILQAQVPIREWPVPYADSRPHDPYVDDQGRVWFVGQKGNYLAYLEPESGRFKRYELEDGALPHNLIVDQKGIVWYAGNGNGHIGKLDPATGKITRYPMPNPEARDPHTLVFDDRGDVWFTVQNSNFVGRLRTGTGKIDLIEVATPNARVGFDPETEKFFGLTPIPSGGGTVRHMMYDKRSGQIWFGTDNNTIGRAQVTEASLSS